MSKEGEMTIRKFYQLFQGCTDAMVDGIANLTKRILHGRPEVQNFSSNATKINNLVLPARSHFMDQ